MANNKISHKLAVQMYTVREHTKSSSDLAKTLKNISEIGYTAVQMSAVGAMDGDEPEVDAKTARKMLDDNGLSCIATHRKWPQLTDGIEKEIEFHHEIGCDFTAIGGLPPNYERTAEGFEKFANDAGPVLGKLNEAGIRFGYHNHSWEFFRPVPGEKTLLDTLIQSAPAKMLYELDLYWIEFAGLNCVRIIEQCLDKMPVIHLKDCEVVGPTKNETRMAPIGEGNLDWQHIIPACEKAGVEWYAVEQDQCYRDSFDCLKSSYQFLSSIEI